MTNILIVESKNDQYFLQYLIEYLNYKIDVEAPICIGDDDYECLNGLSEQKLIQTLKDLAASLQKRDIQKIGIIIDQDNYSEQERIEFVNRCLEAVFTPSQRLTQSCELVEMGINEKITFELGCYFTNVNQYGELETLLKTIKAQPSPHADCLESWRDCVGQAGQAIAAKEFDKFWWSIYLRYDTCSKKERKQAERKCSMKNFDTVLSIKGSQILNLEHEILAKLRSFLSLFDG
ncbi:hypothetical protein PN441_12775 [Spirulina major CS-329]|uniref:DUF3226 domain-containing protein n=1 Tax=Spirulina TaxID=1154 RepID=UPI00232DE466|nr:MULTISPECIES: DUF3226 domain-containing protein [Spirulina]MDB9494404.1 hypothetical protein [Spirulina subsalsa CS-330]MDB9503943.1 hypothetical protein [Spirulina major CS-329]